MGLTATEFREYYRYDPEDGSITRIKKTGRSSRVGKVLGGALPGRRQISIDGKRYWAHRLAWLYMHGEWPQGEIDHVNGDPSDNRLCNLRDVLHSENMQNKRRARSDSTSGLIGAMPHQGRWRSDIRLNGKKQYLGTFATAEEAHHAYVLAKRGLHPFGTL